mmetsp:Transcript_148164/g.258542  ORF Transcript_148164/g.258542 Transcript_148164/m.258542 type:complete len:812 (-) Transcript_148164:73-2508(-)
MAIDFSVQIESSASESTPTHIVVSGPLISSVIRKNLMHVNCHVPGMDGAVPRFGRSEVGKYEGGSWWERIRQFAKDVNVDFTQDSTFMSCGMSSSDAVRCSHILSKCVGRALPPTLCFDYKTLREAISALVTSQAEGPNFVTPPSAHCPPGQHQAGPAQAITSYQRFKSRRLQTRGRRRVYSIAESAAKSFVRPLFKHKIDTSARERYTRNLMPWPKTFTTSQRPSSVNLSNLSNLPSAASHLHARSFLDTSRCPPQVHSDVRPSIISARSQNPFGPYMDVLKKPLASLLPPHELGKSMMQPLNATYFDKSLTRTSMEASSRMQTDVLYPPSRPASSVVSSRRVPTIRTQHDITNISCPRLSQKQGLSAHGILAASKSCPTMYRNSKNSITSFVPAARAIPQLAPLCPSVLSDVSTSSLTPCRNLYPRDGASTAQAYVKNRSKLRSSAFSTGRFVAADRLLRYSSQAIGTSQPSDLNTVSSAQRTDSHKSSVHSTRHVAHARTCALSAARVIHSVRCHPQYDPLCGKHVFHTEPQSKTVISQVRPWGTLSPVRSANLKSIIHSTKPESKEAVIYKPCPNGQQEPTACELISSEQVRAVLPSARFVTPDSFMHSISQTSKDTLLTNVLSCFIRQSSVPGSELIACTPSLPSMRNRLHPVKSLPQLMTSAASITASRTDASLRRVQPPSIPCRTPIEDLRNAIAPPEPVPTESPNSIKYNVDNLTRMLEKYRPEPATGGTEALEEVSWVRISRGATVINHVRPHSSLLRAYYHSKRFGGLFPQQHDQWLKPPAEPDPISRLRRHIREAPGTWK